MLLLLHLVGYEARPNSELYSSALSREQAAIIFRLASKMIRLSPDLANSVTIRDTVKELYAPGMGTLYKALSADAPTAMGLSPVFVCHDELGQISGERHPLYEALETAQAAHENPLSVVISTQASTDAALLSRLIDDAAEDHDPTAKLWLWTADKEADPFEDDTLRQANPAFDSFQNQTELRRMAQEAKRMPARESAFRNLVLNQRVAALDAFVSKAIWDENGADPAELDIVYAGLDLSETNDLTAFIKVSPDEDGYSVESTFWLPESGLEDRSRRDRVPYDVWAKEGHLQTTPGHSVEYEYVAQHIADLFAQKDVRKIAFDQWNMKHLRPWLIKAGMSEALIDDRFVNFRQGYFSMSPALRTLEALLLNGKLKHGNHPVLQMCAANAVVKTDDAGNRKLTKAKSRGRIDGMIGLVMACAVASEDSQHQKVYPVSIESIVEDIHA
jgi:phage terminase large subunit-like protein